MLWIPFYTSEVLGFNVAIGGNRYDLDFLNLTAGLLWRIQGEKRGSREDSDTGGAN